MAQTPPLLPCPTCNYTIDTAASPIRCPECATTLRDIRRRDPLYAVRPQTARRSYTFALAAIACCCVAVIAVARYGNFEEAPITSIIVRGSLYAALILAYLAVKPLERARFPKRGIRVANWLIILFATAIAATFLEPISRIDGSGTPHDILMLVISLTLFIPVIAFIIASSRFNRLANRLANRTAPKSKAARNHFLKILALAALVLPIQFALSLIWHDLHDAFGLAAISVIFPGILAIAPLARLAANLHTRLDPTYGPATSIKP